MTLLKKVSSAIDELFAYFSTLSRQNIESYCDFESACEHSTIVNKNGTFVSMIRVHGFSEIVNQQEYAELCDTYYRALHPFLKTSGHNFQFFVTCDHQNIFRDIEQMPIQSDGKKKTCLDFSHLNQARMEALSRYCHFEDVYIVMWTNANDIHKSEYKQIIEKEKKRADDANLPTINNVQMVTEFMVEVLHRHLSAVEQFILALQKGGVSCNVLDSHKMLQAIRIEIDPKGTDLTWKPVLPGDHLPMYVPKSDEDISALLWPKLDQQLLTQGDGETKDMSHARYGDRDFFNAAVSLFPEQLQNFDSLFNSLRVKGVPFWASLRLESNGISLLKLKTIIARFLAFSSHKNKLLLDSAALLQQVEKSTDNSVVKISASFCTWSDFNQDELLLKRKSQLIKSLQSWGGMQVKSVHGDALSALMQTAPAIQYKDYQPKTAAPLDGVVGLLPISRPARVWNKGALFRTPDGRVWPYQSGSSLQPSWIELIFAKSGSGKSVLLNALNLAMLDGAKVDELPYLGIMDIGESSNGIISLLKEYLPSNYHHLLCSHKLQLSKDDAINPFDTSLGLRTPHEAKKAFLVNFLTLLMSDKVSTILAEGMANMLSLIIDEVYHYYSDEQSPKEYHNGLEPIIDQKLNELDVALTDVTTWWQVVDILFEHQLYHLARQAQKYAVPLLSDTIIAVRLNNIADMYQNAKLPSGEGYIDAYARTISSMIKIYPMFSSVTKLDVYDKKIIGFDLEEVTHGGSDFEDKKTAIAYMLARQIINDAIRHDVPTRTDKNEKYYHYHKNRHSQFKLLKKRVVYDEFHRTKQCSALINQIQKDMREGRKHNIQINLCSQSLDDFSRLMTEFATSIFIMGSGNQSMLNQLKSTFSLNETELQSIKHHSSSPTIHGAEFLAQFYTSSGKYSRALCLTLSPIELWALTTRSEDVLLRDNLYQKISPEKARKLLAFFYPQGTALDEIKYYADRNAVNKSEAVDALIERMILDQSQILTGNKVQQL
ncbi:hypothetical protein [Cysteiniphilum sp. JM-1]|uniref:hypothetical protein n=1 Tax=Cysteiniphilum sp. JM-1 TaxID=2610891 RepID=UPI001244761A|nr:hypothetical protein [Cysteiniphilum sp. JM-1]